jgi:FlaA1/EpsC-like NDP-sugar epimerase
MSSVTAVQRPIVVQHCHPVLMTLVLVLTDICSLAASGLIASFLNWSVQDDLSVNSYLGVIPFISIFVLVFAALGLYSGVSPSPPEELRKSTFACILISLCVAASTVSIRHSHVLFTWTIAAAILLSIIAVPLAREIVRLNYSRAAWWGYPAVILGDEQSAKILIQTLHKQTDLGLKPAAFLCPRPTESSHVCGVPVIGEAELASLAPCLRRRGYALLTGTADLRERLMGIISSNRDLFPHVLVIPETWEFSCFSVSPKNLGGVLGLEVRENIFQPGKQLLKKVVDLALTSVLLTLAAPFLLLVALAIKLDSP